MSNRTPKPGKAVRGSRTGRPIMALLELLGRRWMLRIMWELRGDTALGFRELQSVCDGMSPSVLSQRLRELCDAEILAMSDAGYLLTADGRNLLHLLVPLQSWAERWARRSSPGRARKK